jgi:hypothetical protein
MAAWRGAVAVKFVGIEVFGELLREGKLSSSGKAEESDIVLRS